MGEGSPLDVTADNINFPVVQMYRTSNAKSLCSKYLAYGCELTISNYRNITNLRVVRGLLILMREINP